MIYLFYINTSFIRLPDFQIIQIIYLHLKIFPLFPKHLIHYLKTNLLRLLNKQNGKHQINQIKEEKIINIHQPIFAIATGTNFETARFPIQFAHVDTATQYSRIRLGKISPT